MLTLGASRRGRFPASGRLYPEAAEPILPNPICAPETLVGAGGGVSSVFAGGENSRLVGFTHRLSDASAASPFPDGAKGSG